MKIAILFTVFHALTIGFIDSKALRRCKGGIIPSIARKPGFELHTTSDLVKFMVHFGGCKGRLSG